MLMPYVCVTHDSRHPGLMPSPCQVWRPHKGMPLSATGLFLGRPHHCTRVCFIPVSCAVCPLPPIFLKFDCFFLLRASLCALCSTVSSCRLGSAAMLRRPPASGSGRLVSADWLLPWPLHRRCAERRGSVQLPESPIFLSWLLPSFCWSTSSERVPRGGLQSLISCIGIATFALHLMAGLAWNRNLGSK